MKLKRKSKLILWIFAFALCLCSFSMTAFAADAESISINQTKNLMVGDSKPLILSVSPANADVPAVNWTSSDNSIATVDAKGIVTGVKAGQVTITATAKNNSDLTASVTMLVRTNYKYDIGWSGSFTSTDNNTTTTADIPVESSKIKKIWQAKVGNSPIVILDEYIYTYDGVNMSGSTDNDGTLYKVDKATGEIVDQLTCKMSGGYYYSYILYGGGLLYVSSTNKVMAVDPDSFTVLWYADVPDTFYATAQFVGDCLVTRGVVLNSTTGEKVATLSGTYGYSSGVEKNGLYYIASTEGVLHAFDTKTWEEKDSVTFREEEGGGFQPGVMLYNGRLYWSDPVSENMYSIQLKEDDNLFNDETLIATNCGIQSVCVPVAANDRVYLAGQKNDAGVIAVFNAGNLSLAYTAEGANQKIQSTPILRIVKDDGPSIMSLGSFTSPKALANGNYLVVQDYGMKDSSVLSTLRVLKDVGGATSGSMSRLVTIDPPNFAYQQLACDKDGSLYCTNDSGYLVKYRNVTVALPQFTKDLSTKEVRYGKDAKAEALEIEVTVSDGGTLTYQWQSRTEKGTWQNISGATTATYTPSTATEGITYYRCEVTNTLSGESEVVNSKSAKIIVGNVAVEDPVLYGDVDGNGEVNAKDVTMLCRHLADWDGYKVIDTVAADVNLDDEVNAKDATNLARYLADWPGVTIGK